MEISKNVINHYFGDDKKIAIEWLLLSDNTISWTNADSEEINATFKDNTRILRKVREEAIKGIASATMKKYGAKSPIQELDYFPHILDDIVDMFFPTAAWERAGKKK